MLKGRTVVLARPSPQVASPETTMPPLVSLQGRLPGVHAIIHLLFSRALEKVLMRRSGKKLG